MNHFPRNEFSSEPFYGVYPAIVTDIIDPDRLGRVEVSFPWLGEAGDTVRAWATLLSPYADDDQGLLVFPAVDSQVVVAFEAGIVERPYIVGSCWNGKEMPPVSPTRPNDRRVLKTRAGSELAFDDRAGSAKVTLRSASHSVVIDEGTGSIEIRHANGSSIVLNSAGQVEITATGTIELTAAALNVHAASATFDGMVTCTTLIAQTAVVSPSYTPGAGNVW
jgi:uncharacterized protein involved in type VI secretion and phage assembly